MGSEMCIRDSTWTRVANTTGIPVVPTTTACARMDNYTGTVSIVCLLYTSDAADERSSVDLGGRRIIKKKTTALIADRHSTT